MFNKSADSATQQDSRQSISFPSVIFSSDLPYGTLTGVTAASCATASTVTDCSDLSRMSLVLGTDPYVGRYWLGKGVIDAECAISTVLLAKKKDTHT